MRSDEWIKMRGSLLKDGRVRILSRKLGTNVPSAVGHLFAFWWIADEFAGDDGVLHGWTKEDVDHEVGRKGFCEMLPSCWVDLSGEYVQMPNYTQHNGKTTKVRLLDKERKARQRKAGRKSDICPTESGTLSPSPSSSKSLIKKENSQAAKLFEPAPVWPGCENLRLTQAQHKQAEAWYQKRNLSPEVFAAAIEETDLWLGQDTARAKQARKSHTQRILYQGWVVERATKKVQAITPRRKTTKMDECDRLIEKYSNLEESHDAERIC